MHVALCLSTGAHTYATTNLHGLSKGRRDFHVDPFSETVLPAEILVHALDDVRLLVVEAHVDPVVVGGERKQRVSQELEAARNALHLPNPGGRTGHFHGVPRTEAVPEDVRLPFLEFEASDALLRQDFRPLLLLGDDEPDLNSCPGTTGAAAKLRSPEMH